MRDNIEPTHNHPVRERGGEGEKCVGGKKGAGGVFLYFRRLFVFFLLKK